MMNDLKKRFRAKIITSYLILGVLTLIVGFFIFFEIKTYILSQNTTESDSKLIKTSALLTHLYDAESLSKIAFQHKTKSKFNSYIKKIDSILVDIDQLKLITNSKHQTTLLDSVQILLLEKVKNSTTFWNLKSNNNKINSIDTALKEFHKMEASFGRLTIYNFEKKPEKLSPYKRKVLENWVAYLNKNIPEEKNIENIDSIISISKSLLTKARETDIKTQYNLNKKELTLARNDLALSQQLQHIIYALEQELNNNNLNNITQRKKLLKKSIRLAGLAAIIGFLIVAFFTFLITKDYWKSQLYRIKLEKEKKYSESLLKSREQLISTVSHDLKTPLNTILGYSELMQNTSLNNKQFNFLKSISSASNYINNLVNDLLDYSKLEAEKIRIHKSPFILSELITETAENIKEQHAKKPIQLILDIDDSLKKAIVGDALRIRQVVTNIISNAYKFTDHGTITVKAFIKNVNNNTCTTIINISDTGIGIKKEKQELIFKEFSQADITTEKKYGGYGLGLTISKKLITLLGGSLELKSEIQKGSTFSISLPLKTASKAINAHKELKTNTLKKLSILIIDDDLSMLGLLKEVCNNLDITSHTFHDFNLIKTQEKISYDIILTDIQMPTITGFKVLKELKSTDYIHYKNQPIIAMTGRKKIEKSTYTNAGFTSILYKPFSKDELLKILLGLFPNYINVVKTNTLKTTKKSTSTLFNLTILHSFLGNDINAISDILKTFITETTINTGLLKNAILNNNTTEIQNIAHRMLPMFRQLETKDIIPILEELEEQTNTKKSILLNIFADLKNKITALKLALESYLAINPAYNG